MHKVSCNKNVFNITNGYAFENYFFINDNIKLKMCEEVKMAEILIEYEKEKENRTKRLEAYAEQIKNSTFNRTTEIVNELVEERKRQHMTQQDIANITGVQASNIARFETAKTIPTLGMLQKYAAALGKRIDLLIVDDM